MIPERLQMTLVIVVIAYFITLCVFLKNKVLSLKYVLLWIFAGIMMTVLIVFPDLLVWVDNLIGIQSTMNGLFIWTLGFIICIILSLTSIVSRQNNKIRQLIQIISRMEERIRGLENDKEH